MRGPVQSLRETNTLRDRSNNKMCTIDMYCDFVLSARSTERCHPWTIICRKIYQILYDI